MAWTEEKLDHLKRLLAEAMTASQIARALGVPRGAVIDKVHRLGLTLPFGTVAGKPKSGRKPQARRPKVTAVILHAVPASEPPAILRNGVHVGTIDLQRRDCRWPHGDPQEARFHYCANPAIANSPYCAFHASRAWRRLRSDDSASEGSDTDEQITESATVEAAA